MFTEKYKENDNIFGASNISVIPNNINEKVKRKS